MATNHASAVLSVCALAKPASTATANVSAMTTFFIRPRAKAYRPGAKLSKLKWRFCASANCGTISLCSTIGPAISWGKKVTNSA